MLIHEDKKPHKCGICNRGFRRKDKLNEHMKAMHAVDFAMKQASQPDKQEKTSKDNSAANLPTLSDSKSPENKSKQASSEKKRSSSDRSNSPPNKSRRMTTADRRKQVPPSKYRALG